MSDFAARRRVLASPPLPLKFPPRLLYRSYTRNLVDDGNGKFNVMVLCWNGGQGRCDVFLSLFPSNDWPALPLSRPAAAPYTATRARTAL